MTSPTDKYILDVVKTWVWSGFYSPSEVDERIGEILEDEGDDADDADEAQLRAAVRPEFAKKAAAEKSWPSKTDCDRLDEAFAQMNSRGITALQNAGTTLSDGIADVAELLHRRGRTGVKGYCFYHGQDLARAVAGDGLTLAFGDLDDDPSAKTAIGHQIREVLETFGFTVEWNGDPETRLEIPVLDWKRRGPR